MRHTFTFVYTNIYTVNSLKNATRKAMKVLLLRHSIRSWSYKMLLIFSNPCEMFQSEKPFPSLAFHPVFQGGFTNQLHSMVLKQKEYITPLTVRWKYSFFTVIHHRNYMYCNCSIIFQKLESPQPWKWVRIFLYDGNMLCTVLSC